MTQALSDQQRRAIHDLALEARELLTREARELLEGTYGLYPDGRLEAPEKLPQVQDDPETGETYRRLAQFLEDEARAGLSRPGAVEALGKEAAFTHLNRLVAFKMMEARKLIRGTLDKGSDSNAFKFYLADPEHADDHALYQQGDVDSAYRHFLLWQSAQVAAEVRVLFDPDTLPSRLFPRPRALKALLALLNQAALAEAWRADETIGWVYQYFNEPELQAAFEKVRTSGAKFEARDIPSATQLFTPHWIVRFLVQNTLGRLWVRMHSDTRLIGPDPLAGSGQGLLDYLVPLEGESTLEPLRPVKEITLLDPACGTMHFGLVAFDLFAAMYQEELERVGEPGWPDTPSVSAPDEIPAAIIRHNLFGIDIDLRAVQLSALALYLKAKSLHKKAKISDSNLACADVRPLNGARLGTFLREARFTRPIYERLIRALWERLKDIHQLGSLLRLEGEIGELIAQERARYEEMPLFAGLPSEFEREAAEEEFWGILSAQVVQGLDEFARQQAQAGVDQTLFAGEAVKGLRLAELMLRRYDVVITNPPYMSGRKMDRELAKLLRNAYPEGKGDFFAAFIQRCLELAEDRGYVGMLTMHSFMFISSYKPLRREIHCQAAIETTAHCGPGLFDVGNPGTLQTTAFALRKEPETVCREGNIGTYYRLVHTPTSDGKRQAFERALEDGSNAYYVAQQRFDAISGSPWVYWISEAVRQLFETLPKLGDVAKPRQGLATTDNFRFLRLWWEVGQICIAFGCRKSAEAHTSNLRWFPYMKGGGYCKWYGNQDYIINYYQDGYELKTWVESFPETSTWSRRIASASHYFQEGITYSYLTSAKFSARYLPPGYIFDVAGSSIFPPFVTEISKMISILNAQWTRYALGLINPTVNFQVGDLKRLPICTGDSLAIEHKVVRAIRQQKMAGIQGETTFDFTAPPYWKDGLNDLAVAETRLTKLEREIDEDVYHLYGISNEDRVVIEDELIGSVLAKGDDQSKTSSTEAPITCQELAVRWISYAIGVVLGRFQPGLPGALGCAVYRRADFAIGSLPEPDEAEFDELVGPAERFAYVDAEGGRHVFSAEVEKALCDLAVPDGITVLDQGHPRDLPALAARALALMLGDEAVQDVVNEGAGGNLRRFLERDFFTKWHMRWYRKRPVYWPLQSARRSYGLVLFHERVGEDTLYVLQREYLDHKLNGLRLEIGDLQGQLEGLSGAARKRVERQSDRAAQLLDEVSAFAATMERIVNAGYRPEPNWIDDGVILRLAPLWELMPIWKSEPKKYWARLEKGDFDWSHIAMGYWPERAREKCKVNKSYAIAHGHEEWYEGT
jgi:hypothetical protein